MARRRTTIPFFLRVALVGAAALASTACVSQAKYEEALDTAKFYQRGLQDLESFHGTCEAEIARLRGELAIRAGEPIEAGMTAEIDQRLAELGQVMERLGRPGDVSMLSVEGGYGVRLSNAVLFDSGSAELTAEGRALLAKMATEIQGRPFQRIWVRGHSDSDPIVKTDTLKRFPYGNLQLSSERALRVAAELAEAGVSWSRLVIAGFGPTEPVVPNDSAANKGLNRRVELFVIEESGTEGRPDEG